MKRIGVITVDQQGNHDSSNNRRASSELLIRERFTQQLSLMSPASGELHLVGLCLHTKYSILWSTPGLFAAPGFVLYVWCHVDLNRRECGNSVSSAITKVNNSSTYCMRCIRISLSIVTPALNPISYLSCFLRKDVPLQ